MFTTPLGLLGLLAVPAIVALHLYRRRYRPRTVSALFLWESVTADPASGRSREPLRRNASLALELLAAACLALALAGPRLFGSSAAEHLVVVLDGTASMTAAVGGAPTPHDRALAELSAAIDELPASSRVTVVRTGPEPSVIAGPLAFPAEAKQRTSGAPGEASGHDLEAAIVLASEFSRGGQVLLLTDRLSVGGASGPLGNLRVRALGTSLQNVGIVGAQRVPGDTANGGDLVRIVVRSFSDRPESREIVLEALADGPGRLELKRRTFELEPDASRAFSFELPSSAGTVAITVSRASGPDALACDDRAVLPPAPRRRIRLASTLDGGTTRALGLGAEAGGIEQWLPLVPDATAHDDPRTAHLVLCDRPAPGSAWSLVVDGRTATSEARGLSHLVGPFLIDTTHPLLRGVTLDGVVWSLDESIRADGNALVLAGEIPLVTESIDGSGARVWRLVLDPKASNLDRSPDWPILLANAAELRRDSLPGPVRTSLAAGEAFHWRGAPFAALTLVDPTGATTRVERLPGGDVYTPRLDRTGRWILRSDLGEAASPASSTEIGVSLMSPTESDLRGAGPGTLDPEDDGARLAGVTPAGDITWFEGLLLALALLAVALDWWVLRPQGGRA